MNYISNFILKACIILACISLFFLIGCTKRPLKHLNQYQVTRTVHVTDEYALSGKKTDIVSGFVELGAATYIGATALSTAAIALFLPVGILVVPCAIIGVGGMVISGFLVREAFIDLNGREEIVDELEIIDEIIADKEV